MKKKKRRMLLWGCLSFIILACIAMVFVYQTYLSTLNKFSINDPNKNNDTPVKERALMNEPFVMLLYGIDQRPKQNDAGRPDTLMLALIDPELLKITLISIPRDSYVDIPGHRKDKINHTYPLGGPELTIQTIEEWFDIDIHGYTSIDFNGFKELVDLVGGVDVYVDRSIQYDARSDGTNIHLSKGQHTLDGEEALGFVRARLDNRGPRYYTSDYVRMERQQLVLKALGSEILSWGSIPQVFDILDVLGDNIDSTLTPKELDFLIKNFYKFKMSNLETTSVQGQGIQIRGGWYEEIDQTETERIQQLIHNFLERKPNVTKSDDKNGTNDLDHTDGEANTDS